MIPRKSNQGESDFKRCVAPLSMIRIKDSSKISKYVWKDYSLGNPLEESPKEAKKTLHHIFNLRNGSTKGETTSLIKNVPTLQTLALVVVCKAIKDQTNYARVQKWKWMRKLVNKVFLLNHIWHSILPIKAIQVGFGRPLLHTWTFSKCWGCCETIIHTPSHSEGGECICTASTTYPITCSFGSGIWSHCPNSSKHSFGAFHTVAFMQINAGNSRHSNCAKLWLEHVKEGEKMIQDLENSSKSDIVVYPY